MLRNEVLNFQAADERLYDIFFNHEFSHITHEQRHLLVKFYQLLMQAKPDNNMTRLVKFRDVAIKHFIDCLIIPRLIDLKFPLLDVGTGAGFPGIPLKILFPEEPIWLGEGVLKRVEFLKQVREELGLKNLEIIGRNITSDFKRPVQGVITRALANSGLTLDLVKSALVPGGRVYLMKGPNVDAEKSSSHPDFKLVKDLAYELPKTPHQRRLVVFERL